MKKLWTALLCGCGIEPFETPSAYDQQRYLCEELDLLEESALACLEEDESCRGFISFQGQIQRVQLRVDTELQRGIVRVVEDDDGVQHLSRVELSGAAPYFHFDVAVSSIGAPWPEEATDTHFTVDFDTPSPDTAWALDFDDGLGGVQWYIRAGSDTAMLTSNPDDPTTEENEGGTIGVSHLSDDRVDLRFGGSIGPVDDSLNACAIVFPERIEIVR